jgi:Alpha/beta hydrolase domain
MRRAYRSYLLTALLATVWTASRGARPAIGQVRRVEILGREAPALGGRSFGDVGRYEKIEGRVHGEVDPGDPRNRLITDLGLAPRSAAGKVEYAADFVLLKPMDMARASGILRYVAPNRGGADIAADPYFLARGEVFLWGAWQGDVPRGPGRLALDVPVVRNPDGSPITGTVRVEFVGRRGARPAAIPLQGNAYNRGQVPYPPARLDDPTAVLTRRRNEGDPRLFIPRDDWAFAASDFADHPFPGRPDPTRVSLRGGFAPEFLYELVYTARDPKVMGLGLAAVRDLVAFFRHGAEGASGGASPLGSHIRFAMGTGVSQSGNFLKTFVHLGFNDDTEGRRVFDALFPIVAARQTNLNARFAVPGGGGGLRAEHRAFGQASVRGFAAEYRDAIRGSTGGIFRRGAATGTTPKTFLALSGTELWVLQGSPALTDAHGTRDLEQPDDLRIYYFAGTQHFTRPPAWDPSATAYPAGVRSEFDAILRALWVRLEAWMVEGTPPPAGRVPRLADGTLVRPEDLRYPAMRGVWFPVGGADRPIPEFRYRGWYNGLGLLDFGPRFDEADETGIADWLPPAYLGKDYAILVSAVDGDGNEAAGVQPVGNRAPLGTNLPYNYDADPEVRDLAGLLGAFLPFHRTKAGRIAAGDGRPSLEERYGTHAGYVAAVRDAADALLQAGFLLPDDRDRIIAGAEASDVLR